MDWENLLLYAEKPSRYLGTEVNASRKGKEAEFNFALAFPDTYEVGMSHLGIQIIYNILNGIPRVSCERCFAPWPDMEQLLRKHGLPLTSLESRRPLHAFDMIGFSLQYELSYTNILNMLELGGIPLLRKERKAAAPLVIAGGPCAFNPAPLEAFIDVFVIGEGEEVVREIALQALEAKKKRWTREDTLASLAEIDGVYAPAAYRDGKKIRKRVVRDLDTCSLPLNPVVPLMKTIHDRISIEIARGCTRGCRFCQAGMVWRPVRERKQELIEKTAASLLCATGYDEISLLSLSSGDYSRIEPLLAALMDRYYEKRVALALPSLRVETLTRNLMENIRRVRKTSFTLAPEAGTQRLRDIINKGNTEAELLSTTRQVFEAGWKSIKLYFMLGLPGEKKEDLEGIAELAYQALKEGKQRGQITVSLSTLIPKAHTPFQWQRQINLEEIREKQAFLKGRIRNRNISLKWHSGRMSLLEGILSRGDEKTGILIREAFRLGCRFDGWADMLRFDLWEEAIRRTGISVDDYLGVRNHAQELPWDRIDCGINRDFLLVEAEKSLAGEATADCRSGYCNDCGVCDNQTIKVITAASLDLSSSDNNKPDFPVPEQEAGKETKLLRIQFTKDKSARFLSHLEVSEALIRAIRRSGLPFVYSQGYHPHPRISFAFATSVGMASNEEYADIRIETRGEEPAELGKKINAFLPEGLEIVGTKQITDVDGGLAVSINGFSYAISLHRDIISGQGLKEKIETFLKSDVFIITRETKEKRVEKNIRPLVSSLSVDEEKHEIALSVRISSEGTVRPVEIWTKVLGISEDRAKTAQIVKTKTHWATADC